MELWWCDINWIWIENHDYCGMKFKLWACYDTTLEYTVIELILHLNWFWCYTWVIFEQILNLKWYYTWSYVKLARGVKRAVMSSILWASINWNKIVPYAVGKWINLRIGELCIFDYDILMSIWICWIVYVHIKLWCGEKIEEYI